MTSITTFAVVVASMVGSACTSETAPASSTVAGMNDNRRAMTSEEVLELSGGPITSPLAYTVWAMPEPKGLYAPEVFGPSYWGKEDFGALLTDSRRGWGHIDLIGRFEHPLVAGQSLRMLVVVPPAYRPYELLDPATFHEQVRRFRDAMVANKDASCDPLPKVLREAGLWNSEAERPMSDEEIGAWDPEPNEPQLTAQYRGIVNQTQSMKRLLELNAPSDVIDQCRTRIQSLLDALMPMLKAHRFRAEDRLIALTLRGVR